MSFLVPTAYAATNIPLIGKINTVIINPLITLMFAVALVVFLYGVLEFIAGHDNEQKVENGKRHMLWGIVGLFIMVSVFGIINLIVDFLTNF